MLPARPRRRHLAVAATALAGLLAAGSLAGCGDKNGDNPRSNSIHPSPGLQTVVPSSHPSPPVTVSPYPSSSASPKRGDAKET